MHPADVTAVCCICLYPGPLELLVSLFATCLGLRNAPLRAGGALHKSAAARPHGVPGSAPRRESAAAVPYQVPLHWRAVPRLPQGDGLRLRFTAILCLVSLPAPRPPPEGAAASAAPSQGLLQKFAPCGRAFVPQRR